MGRIFPELGQKERDFGWILPELGQKRCEVSQRELIVCLNWVRKSLTWVRYRLNWVWKK